MASISSSYYLSVRIKFPHRIHANNKKYSSRRNLRLPFIAYSTALSEGGRGRGGGDAHVFSVTPSSQSDIDYLGQSTKGDLNPNIGTDGRHAVLEGPIEEVARMEAQEAHDLLQHLGIPDPFSARYSQRGIFCSRTLNLRSISAIGYDMDYTLMHYNVTAWEGRAYDYCMDNLRNMGFPVDGLAFDPELVIRGLVIDKEKGNLVKADRFGYVKRAMHGTRMLSTREVRCVLFNLWNFFVSYLLT